MNALPCDARPTTAMVLAAGLSARLRPLTPRLVEEQVLGTAGGVKNVAHLFTGPFFVWYGDNLSNCRLERLPAAVALHQREDPTEGGIVGADKTLLWVDRPEDLRRVERFWPSVQGDSVRP